jgi:FtsP/CotA-like multicopper oxidase with cupredoxin domain
MIVLGPDEVFDPETDHPYIVGWTTPLPNTGWQEDREINGSDILPDIHTTVGVKHRLRLMNIAPAGRIRLGMERDGEVVPVKYIAKDGADLPPVQQVMVESSFRYGVGETADFEFVPDEPGTYTLYFWNWNKKKNWVQKWVVKGV